MTSKTLKWIKGKSGKNIRAKLRVESVLSSENCEVFKLTRSDDKLASVTAFENIEINAKMFDPGWIGKLKPGQQYWMELIPT